MLRRLFQRGRDDAFNVPAVHGDPPRLPEGVRLYAIGDIHGRLDLLLGLEQLILADAESTGNGCDLMVVYIGDYVDRGADSRRVIEHLIDEPLPGFTSVHLVGNHEIWVRDFLRTPEIGSSWLRSGGDATLLSYGIRIDRKRPEEEWLEEVHESFKSALPARHLAFIEGLELAFGFGDYFFCHAGIRPEVALERQSETDLVWIREPFLSWGGDPGKIVIHGHTVHDRPAVRCNRIGIDTGAFWTDRLTCVVLEDERFRFLATHPQGTH